MKTPGHEIEKLARSVPKSLAKRTERHQTTHENSVLSKLNQDKITSDWLSLDFQMVQEEEEEEHVPGFVIDEAKMPHYLKKDTFPASRLYSPPSDQIRKIKNLINC